METVESDEEDKDPSDDRKVDDHNVVGIVYPLTPDPTEPAQMQIELVHNDSVVPADNPISPSPFELSIKQIKPHVWPPGMLDYIAKRL